MLTCLGQVDRRTLADLDLSPSAIDGVLRRLDEIRELSAIPRI
ncbi:hypothetical protein [Nocardia testacea]|uniref:MarR family transcriptional regulator n=1 Tax=Nocardia testacea TaxID=248551 RepID=A0ABW7W5V4_9NOCA